MPEDFTDAMVALAREVDERDEAQILAEIAGSTVDEYIYEVYDKKDKTKRLAVKLSWVGTREMARQRGNLHVGDYPDAAETDSHWRIAVKVTDLKRNFSVFGGCHQPKKMRINIVNKAGEVTGHELVEDPFAYQKALNKAQRNGFQNVMPAGYMAKWIDKMLQLSGRRPLRIPERTTRVAQPKARADTSKPLPTADTIKTLLDFEKAAWNRYKLQPAAAYKEVGYGSKSDVNESPWQLWQQLMATLEPEAEPGAEPQGEEVLWPENE